MASLDVPLRGLQVCAAYSPRVSSVSAGSAQWMTNRPLQSLLTPLCPMLQAGRLPACLHGLAGNGVWLLSLDLKEVERAVRDLGPLSPGTCTCRSDLSLVAHQAAHRPPSSQQSDLVHNASLYALAMGFCTLEAAVPHPGMSGLRQSHTAAAAAAAGQCSGILSGCSLLFYLRPPCTTAVVLSTSHLACPAVQVRLHGRSGLQSRVYNLQVGEDMFPGLVR